MQYALKFLMPIWIENVRFGVVCLVYVILIFPQIGMIVLSWSGNILVLQNKRCELYNSEPLFSYFPPHDLHTFDCSREFREVSTLPKVSSCLFCLHILGHDMSTAISVVAMLSTEARGHQDETENHGVTWPLGSATHIHVESCFLVILLW